MLCTYSKRERERGTVEWGNAARHNRQEAPCIGVEWSVGRFSRLRTPLGLVMRRLSADRDRGTGCIPNATLYSAAMSDRTGMCSPLTTMGLLFSSLPPVSPSSPRISPCLFPCFASAAPASSVLLERVISDHVGGCLTRYTASARSESGTEPGTCSVGEPHAARDASRIYGDDRDDTRR